MADIIPIEQEGVAVHDVEPLFHFIGDGGFAGTGQAGEPQHACLLIFERSVGISANVRWLPMHILRAAQAEIQHARAHGTIVHLVDQDEPAQRA